MGQPRKLTQERRDQVLVALRAGADMGLAARAVGVSRRGLYALRARDPEFKEAVDEARSFADAIIIKRLFDKAREGDTTAMIFWLKNRRPSEWRDRRHHAHTGDVTINVVTGVPRAPNEPPEREVPAL